MGVPFAGQSLLPFAHPLGHARFNELDGIAKQRLEVIARVMFSAVPLESKPGDVFTYGVDVRCVLFDWIGVVKWVDRAPILLGKTANSHRSPWHVNVQVAVGLWRGISVHPSSVHACFPVGIHQLLNEMTTLFAFFIPLRGCVRLGSFHGTKLHWTFAS